MTEKTMREQPSISRGAGAKIALLAGALVAALLLGEIGVRLIGAAPVLSRINPMMKKTVFRVSENPLLGYLHKKNYRDPDGADLVTSYPYINAHGFRDIERTLEKPPGTKRILMLGDSVVAGHMFIESVDDTISRQLEQLLEGRNIEVLNMGITGYCTRGEVELLKEIGVKFQPDLVLLVFITNDYVDINMDLGYATPSAPVRFLVLNSHLFRYLGVTYNLFHLRTQFGVQEMAGEWAGELYFKDDGRKEKIVGADNAESETIRNHLVAIAKDRDEAHTATNVHAAIPLLKQLSDEYGFKVLIGAWPFFRPFGIIDYEGYGASRVVPVAEGQPLVIEKLAEANGIPSFRFSEEFLRDYAERKSKIEGEIAPPDAIYGKDMMHPNPLAAGVAARAILRVLEANPELIE